MNYYSPEMVEPCPVPIVQHVVVVRETMVDSNGIVLGAWSSQLHHAFFDCRLPNTCLSFCCPCVSAANIVKRLGMYSYRKVFWGILIAYSILIFLSMEELFTEEERGRRKESYRFPLWELVGWILSLSVTFFVWKLRMRIRAMFKIPGNAACDFVTVLFCQCCVLAQMASHVKSYTPGSCDCRAPETLPGYNGEEAMEAGQIPKTEENDGIVLNGNWPTALSSTST